MTFSYLANGRTLGDIDTNNTARDCVLLLANNEHQPDEHPSSPVDTLNLRCRHLNHPTKITSYLSKCTSTSHPLVSLNLSNNGLADFPCSLQHLADLCELNLATNQFTQLPPVLYTFAHLQHLNIADNDLVDLGELAVNLPHLRTLKASNNRLEHLDDRIGLWQDMSLLQLGQNRLVDLPHTLMDMVRLEEVDFSGNQLQGWPSSLPALKHLNISGNHYTTIPHDLLLCYPNLETLDMSSNDLAVLPCIMNSIQSRLRLVNLSDNSIYIVPTSVLKACGHVNLMGNPTLEYHRTSMTDCAQKLRDLAKIAVYSTPQNCVYMDTSLIELLHPSSHIPLAMEPAMVSAAELSPRFALNDSLDTFTSKGERWIPSLRELAMRSILELQLQDSHHLSYTSAHEMQMEIGCDICGRSCVNEWLSTIHVNAHQIYSSVVCKVTLCSTTCWLTHYRKTRKSHALPTLDLDTPLSRAFPDASLWPLNTLPTDSFEWIVAAASASALQIEQDRSLE